jgi:FkbM family methyltransferase
LILTTKTKITLAGIAYRVITLARRLVGKSNWAVVRRSGLWWRLDLSEGIDFSIYLLGSFERSTVEALANLVKPGDTVFDIGANIGAHTLGLARMVGPQGRVFAFEPADCAFDKLNLSLTLNPALVERTRAYQIMLTSQPSSPPCREIYASWPLISAEAVHPKLRGRLVSSLNADVDTLDDFVERERIERLDLIKIDVDGNEYPVLKGGMRTLLRFRPALLMEMSPYVHAIHGQLFASLVDLLRDAGYSIRDAGRRRELPLDSRKLEELIPDGASINVIASRKNP